MGIENLSRAYEAYDSDLEEGGEDIENGRISCTEALHAQPERDNSLWKKLFWESVADLRTTYPTKGPDGERMTALTYQERAIEMADVLYKRMQSIKSRMSTLEKKRRS